MTPESRWAARISSLVLGLAATVITAAFGLTMLRSMTRFDCYLLPGRIEAFRVTDFVHATEEFVADRGRCPTGTTALVADRYIEPNEAHNGYGGPLLLTCWMTPDHTFVQVRSAGRDKTFGTADDLVADSEGDDLHVPRLED
jgi:hypothetical protein